jgi:hypothetical protein
MKVKSAPGIKVPVLGKPGQFIVETRIVEVPEEHYYRAMVNDGDLIEATDKEWEAQCAADEKALAEAVAADKKTKAAAAKAASAN